MAVRDIVQAAAGVGGAKNYIEDVFSTYLYTGTGSTQTITNGIDLAGEGGLVWIKARSVTSNHRLFDTDRGVLKPIYSNLTNAQATEANTLTAFNANGFTLGSDTGVNQNTQTWASWTFRKQEKFFDVLTWTGDGASTRTISHSLGSTPGCIIAKSSSLSGGAYGSWTVYHRGAGTGSLFLNTTGAYAAANSAWQNTAPTSTEFYVDSNLNQNGATYVAYLFAHNAGGFGLSNTDNVISCGSYTGNGSANGPEINLGYEPQWLLTKRTELQADWEFVDIMRGMSSAYYRLFGTTAIEDFESDGVTPTATGFKLTGVQPTHNASGGNYIYIAIRRGPMKVPESGTSVFNTDTTSGSTFPALVAGFPVDLGILTATTGAGKQFQTRMMGIQYLDSTSTAAEVSGSLTGQYDSNVGFCGGIGAGYMAWMFRRAPGFMDVVCYTGNVTNRNIPHNLGVAPELVIGKRRSGAEGWYVWCAYAPNSNSATFAVQLSSSLRYLDWGGGLWGNYGGSVNMNATTYSIGPASELNQNASTNVTYLFATCPGVSKVGSYTGTGTTLQINCGFTGGARFVLIKRVDGTGFTPTGDWYVWDSARGIVAGNDPYLLLNSTNAEVTSTDYIDTYSAGFEISSTAPAAINASGGTFIFLAIA